MSDQAVFVVQVPVSDVQIRDIINTLNINEINENEDGELTYEEVINNPPLLRFLCESAVEGEGLHDPDECWNNDGFSGFEDYRD